MIDWLLNTDNTYFLRHYAELFTIIVSLVGIAVTFLHYTFFKTSDLPLSRRIKLVFLSDSLVYVVTFLMGVGLFYNLSTLVHYDIIVRPFVLTLNVYATIRLFYHFRSIG